MSIGSGIRLELLKTLEYHSMLGINQSQHIN